MKGKVVTLKIYGKEVSKQFMIMDSITKNGETKYLICDEPGNVKTIDPEEIDNIQEINEKQFKDNVLEIVLIAEHVIQEIKKQFVKPNVSDGLEYSVSDLKEIFKTIHELPLKTQAMYADKICKERTRNGFKFEELNRSFIEQMPSSWNTSSVGNLAFIALNHPITEYRVNANDFLNQYKEWRKLNA